MAGIYDAQAHIWADASPDRPWQPEWFQRAHRFPALGGEELLTTMDDAGVERAVLVQPSWAGDDNDVVIAAAERHPERFTVMARVPVDREAGERLLDALAPNPVVKGVRLTFHRPEMQSWLTDGSVDWLWPALVDRGLAAMVFAPGRNAELAEVAREHPRLGLAIDSLGLELNLLDDEIDAPLLDLRRFAAVPNVVVKATALPAYVSDPYPYASLGPRLRLLMDTLGPHRVMWASDLTRVAAPYHDIVTFPSALGVLSDYELSAFMGGNLERWLSASRDIEPTASTTDGRRKP